MNARNAVPNQPTDSVKTERVELPSEEHARAIAAVLITNSCWFELTPMPDDVWEFRVKPDAKAFIATWFELIQMDDGVWTFSAGELRSIRRSKALTDTTKQEVPA